MMEAISPVAAMIQPEALSPASQGSSSPSSFGTWFSRELSEVNNGLVNADTEIQSLAVGEPQSLHEVMIHLEEARLSFQLMLQVRNRLLEAYQEVMRTQI